MRVITGAIDHYSAQLPFLNVIVHVAVDDRNFLDYKILSEANAALKVGKPGLSESQRLSREANMSEAKKVPSCEVSF
jgi:hypothetical protein